MTRTGKFLPNESEITVIDYDTDISGEENLTDADKKTDAIAEALKTDSEAFLNVSRQSQGGNSPMEFVGRFPADKYDFGQLQSYLQSTYGPGDYRVMLYAKGKVKANRLLSIAAPIKKNDEIISGQTDQLSLVLREFQKMQAQMMTLVQQQNNGGNSRREMLEEMLMYKQLFSSNNGPSTGIKDIIETVSGLKELGINIGGNSDDEDGFGKLLDKATPLIEAAIHAPRQPTPQYKQNPVQPNMMNFAIAQGVKTMINAASKNSDPGMYAPLIVDNFNPGQIKNFFVDPNGFNVIKGINPEVEKYKAWFDDLAEHVKALIGMPSKFTDLYDDDEGDIVDADDINGEQTTDGANHL